MKKFKFFTALVISAALFSTSLITADSSSTAWISTSTLSSVVKLGVVLEEYYVEGLPENYRYKEVNGKPYFGGAKVVRTESEYTHVGSGVVVTEDGLIVSNAHVTMAYQSPTVQPVYFNGKPATGPSGKPLTMVAIEKYPRYMFVGVTDKNSIESGDDKQRLKYVAVILSQDSDYERKVHDRAVLQITNYVQYDSGKVPSIGKKVGGEKFSYSKLGNPFKYDYLEKDVRAVGFPGVGDPNRAAVTAGTRIGYADDKRSVILHTSFISGGNSGGGLFYNDALIGINTWDNQQNPSRPVSMAQPITYWNRVFSEMKWLFPNLKFPEYSDEWLMADPSEKSDKDMATVHFCVMQAHNTKTPLKDGYLVALKEDMTGRDFWNYLEYSEMFEKMARMVYFSWLKSDEEMMAQYEGLTAEDLAIFRSIEDLDDMKKYIKKELHTYYDLWMSPDFVLSINELVVDGKTNVVVPRNSKTKIFYMPAERETVTQLGTLTVNNDAEQGPYYVYLED